MPSSQPSHRSPRHLDANHPAVKAVPLDDKTPPAEDAFSWRLWLECKDLAQLALESDYVQGLKNGTLDPNRYGQYTVQDAVYCERAETDYQTVEQRAQAAGESDIASFAKARHESYASYNQSTFAAWHIADPSAMELSDAAQAYADFEHKTATEAEPIFGLIMMIPCNQLWAWLASELKNDAGPNNLYSFWITGNNDWGGAYRLDNFIDAWHAAHPGQLDHRRALYTYRSAMTGELNFFRSACGQELEAMPAAP